MRVVIADDSLLLREGVGRVLQDAGLEVCAAVGTGPDLVAAVCVHRPDIAVVDLRMPPGHATEGLNAALDARRQHPHVGILVLSQYLEAHVATRLLDGGASGVGYLLKDRVIARDDFVASVRRVAAGGVALDPEVVSLLMHPRPRSGPLDELTPRERSVLAPMAEGRSNSAIGRALFIAPKTVESAVRSIFLRLGLPEQPDDHRRVLAVITYLENR